MLYGDTRFGDLQTVRTLVGSIIPFTGTAVITGDGGITIERAHTTRHQLEPVHHAPQREIGAQLDADAAARDDADAGAFHPAREHGADL